MAIKVLRINSKKIQLMKPITSANYDGKTVLTNSSWEYVELWLKRQRSLKASRALFYWTQAKNFYNASENLPIESRPLTSYYCCLNAAKALLAIKGRNEIDFDKLSHGITSDRKQWESSNNISNAKVKFLGAGVLFELSRYFSEDHCGKIEYSVYDLMYNIPCIHRAFSITYNCTELFIPIKDVHYKINTDLKKGWVQFQIDKKYANGNSLRYKPKNYEKDESQNSDKYLMRSKKRFDWDIHGDNKERLNSLSNYHSKIRKDLLYIYGDMRLWYLKKDIPTNNHILKRNSITLIFSVFHWLSELVRYNPEKFDALMKTKQNWIIHEFVDNCLYQYIDEISCEITGNDIMTSGYRK